MIMMQACSNSSDDSFRQPQLLRIWREVIHSDRICSIFSSELHVYHIFVNDVSVVVSRFINDVILSVDCITCFVNDVKCDYIMKQSNNGFMGCAVIRALGC